MLLLVKGVRKMSRHAILVMLVGVNLLLLATIILTAYSPPAAYAQAVGGAGNYIMVSGQIDPGHDAVYLFDLRNRFLHVITSSRGRPVTISRVDTRDLSRDFRAR